MIYRTCECTSSTVKDLGAITQLAAKLSIISICCWTFPAFVAKCAISKVCWWTHAYKGRSTLGNICLFHKGVVGGSSFPIKKRLVRHTNPRFWTLVCDILCLVWQRFDVIVIRIRESVFHKCYTCQYTVCTGSTYVEWIIGAYFDTSITWCLSEVFYQSVRYLMCMSRATGWIVNAIAI